MKIAMFSDCCLDLPGGIRAVMYAQKKALEARGHTVYIFSTGYPRKADEIARLAKEKIFVVPSCRVFLRGITPVSRRPSVVRKWILKEHPEVKEFDVYYMHYEGPTSIAGILMGREFGVPTVQMMHGREDEGESNIIPFSLRSIVAWGLCWGHSWYLAHPVKVRRDGGLAGTYAKAKMWTIMVNHANACDVVLTPSRQFAEKLKRYGVDKKIEVVPNGVDDGYFPAEVTERELKEGEALKIIWHSRVSAEKRMMAFLRALAKVRGDWELDVFGGGGDAFRARRFARRHGMKARFHGTTDFKTLQKCLARAHLDVLVSYGFDTFGMTLIEAEAHGVPVFICDPDLAEVFPEGGGVLADGPEAEEMAAAISDLIAHPERVREMSRVMARGRGEVLMSGRIERLIEVFGGIIKS